MAHGQTLLLLLTPNTQLLIATGRRCRETARKRGENENENWFWLNSIYESEHDDDIKRTTVTPNKHKILKLSKFDSGQPSNNFTQAGAGFKAVSETIPVSNGSREI